MLLGDIFSVTCFSVCFFVRFCFGVYFYFQCYFLFVFFICFNLFSFVIQFLFDKLNIFNMYIPFLLVVLTRNYVRIL